MRPLRRLILRHPALAALVAGAALLLRLAVPAGFMPAVDHGRLIVAICDGTGAATTMKMPDMAHHRDEAPTRAEGKCAFADLAQPMTGGADPVLLAAALAFALLLALLAAAWPLPRAAARLRPPLRGPPTQA